jgi:diacylglycerol kinase (ATP)
VVRQRLFLINPTAGRGTCLQIWKQIERIVASDRQAEAIVPSSYEEMRRVAAEAVRAGVDRVIALGGDGTLDAVAAELAGSDTTLGVIPAGTGNDFTKTNLIPRSPQAALAIATGPHIRRLDLGMANGRHPFLNVAGAGFDAEVAAVHRNYPKGLGGTLPYLLGTIATLRRYKPVHVTVTVDEQVFQGPITLVAVANGPQYGGGMRIAPTARRDDSAFDVYVTEAMPVLDMVKLLPRVYTGTYVKDPRVHLLRGRHVSVVPDSNLYVHVDGDVIDPGQVTFELLPRALSVAVPPEAGGLAVVNADQGEAESAYK